MVFDEGFCLLEGGGLRMYEWVSVGGDRGRGGFRGWGV